MEEEEEEQDPVTMSLSFVPFQILHRKKRMVEK